MLVVSHQPPPHRRDVGDGLGGVVGHRHGIAGCARVCGHVLRVAWGGRCALAGAASDRVHVETAWRRRVTQAAADAAHTGPRWGARTARAPAFLASSPHDACAAHPHHRGGRSACRVARAGHSAGAVSGAGRADRAGKAAHGHVRSNSRHERVRSDRSVRRRPTPANRRRGARRQSSPRQAQGRARPSRHGGPSR